MFIGGVYHFLIDVRLELMKEMRDRGIDFKIFTKEDKSVLRGDLTGGTEPQGTPLRSGKERFTCRWNSGVIRDWRKILQKRHRRQRGRDFNGQETDSV